VSELSWKHVDHPGSVVQVGDEITVQVLEVDRERERISLSLKATQQDPWQEFASTHRVGELVYGRVTKLVPFGAFVQVGEGIEGLVHISEMSAHHVDLPEQVVTPGEELWVKIIDLDLQRRRISLSIKQATGGGEVAEEYRERRRARLARRTLHRHSITADDADRKLRGRSATTSTEGPRNRTASPDDQQDADVAA
jgi:small subunit ribosomal protein S1